MPDEPKPKPRRCPLSSLSPCSPECVLFDAKFASGCLFRQSLAEVAAGSASVRETMAAVSVMMASPKGKGLFRIIGG
jgi:hypothetical protein